MGFNTTARGYRQITLLLALAGLLSLLLADLGIHTVSPGAELRRLGAGLLAPDFLATADIPAAIGLTLAFAFQGVALGVTAGAMLAAAWHWRWVRGFSAVIRAVHELFWGLLIIQLFGLSTLTGVLAIGIPYAGIFAKVFGEFLEESDGRAEAALAPGADALSRLLFTRVPLIWRQVRNYTGYRLECAIRASAILGFIGLPTLGFHLETAFRQGHYSAGAALLYILLLLIFSMRWWLRPALVPFYLIGAVLLSPPTAPWRPASWQFFLGDILPAPLRDGGSGELLPWLNQLLASQVLPGLWQTLLVGCAALLVTGLIGLLLAPLVSPLFGNRASRLGADAILVTLRSLPEFLLAFILLLCLGPSMLPGILALALHTGAIVAHLNGRFTRTLTLRADRPRGINGYFWEVLPRMYPTFLAFLLYRWEIIMRETAVLGILGIHTLGFYVDSAFAEFRLDRALLLIAAGVCLNLGVDAISRRLRASVRLSPSLRGTANA